MDIKEIAKKIEEHVSNGDTESAIQALIEYTKSAGHEQHENAILLSGQYQQCKREKMLGVEQSDNEQRRIEMSILAVLKGLEAKDSHVPGLPNALYNRFETNISRKMVPVIGGVLGLLALILAVWVLASRDNESADNSVGNTDSSAARKNTAIVPKPGTELYSRLPIQPGTDLAVEEKYYTEDRRHYLVFQNDGNLCIYRSDASFVWGSIQAGALQKGGKGARMQEDGNLVILNASGQWMWGTQTTDPTAFLGITANGALIVLNASNQEIWKSR